MPAVASNPQLLLTAFIETAQDLFPDPKPWLKALRNEALTGNSMAVNEVLQNLQAWGAGSVTHQGSSTHWMRELSPLVVGEMAQAALHHFQNAAAGVVAQPGVSLLAFDGCTSQMG